MSVSRNLNFATQLKNFKEKIEDLKAAGKNRLVLIIMSNTHDPALCTGCVKDAAAVRKTFKEICEHIGYRFCSIEISGINYSSKNLEKTFDSMGLYNDVTVFYYSGHGYSYEKDRKSKYPQIDMRSHNNRADFNNIDFIEKNTQNLKVLLQIMRLYGGRINIAIADCCNTTIPFVRKKNSARELDIADDVMVALSKSFTKKLYNDDDNMVCILVSSSTQGQPAITDTAIGSIFTYCFTQTIKTFLSEELKTKQYFPWVNVLKATAEKAFKDSKGYDIGSGIAGKQKAVFEVYIESDSDYEKRMG
ncbi:hypothetical protein BH09BAC2_BH09BAC2_12890 [soil metagenome]